MLVKKIKIIISKIIIRICKVLIKSVGYKWLTLPYSSNRFTVHKLIKDNRLQSSPQDSYNLRPISSTSYFGHEVYHQTNDMRAHFPNLIDEDLTRILVLFAVINFYKKEHELHFLDIGANYGTYSLPCIELNIPHTLVEPNPFIVTCLHKTFTTDNATILSSALVTNEAYDKNSEINMNIMPSLSGGSSIRNSISNSTATQYEVYNLSVKAMTLNEILNHVSAKCDFCIIKLDIEGLELEMFENGFISSISERFSNFVLMVEYLPKLMTERESEIFVSHISEYKTLILSDKSYKPGNSSVSERHKTLGSFFDGNIRISDYYQKNISMNKEEIEKNLKNCNYADLVIFSSIDLAMSFMCSEELY